MVEHDQKDIERRMSGALESLRREFAGLRGGRASTSLLEPVVVDAYGSPMPLGQVGTVGAPEARLLTVQVWDPSLVKSVEKAIREANLGLNPSIDGALVRVPIPELSEERRLEMGKIAGKYAEQTKISVRNVRHHGMDDIKKLEKAGDISRDEQRAWEEDLQKLTDKHIQQIDEALAAKKKEIMQV
jgi:ribosome recycling factor